MFDGPLSWRAMGKTHLLSILVSAGARFGAPGQGRSREFLISLALFCRSHCLRAKCSTKAASCSAFSPTQPQCTHSNPKAELTLGMQQSQS